MKHTTWSLIFWNSLVHIYFDLWNLQCLFNDHIITQHFLSTHSMHMPLCALQTCLQWGDWAWSDKSSSVCVSNYGRVIWPRTIYYGSLFRVEVSVKWTQKKSRKRYITIYFFDTPALIFVISIYYWVNIHLILQQNKS